jgi:hypothetical protein
MALHTLRLALFPLALVFLMAAPADAAVIYNVPATGTAVTTDLPSVPLAPYSIVVSGVFQYSTGPGTPRYRDACYDLGHDLNNISPTQDSVFRVDSVPGTAVDCLVYNPAHIYAYVRLGTGNPFVFDIYDTTYSDNGGALTVVVAA